MLRLIIMWDLTCGPMIWHNWGRIMKPIEVGKMKEYGSSFCPARIGVDSLWLVRRIYRAYAENTSQPIDKRVDILACPKNIHELTVRRQQAV